MNLTCPRCMKDEIVRVDINDGNTLTCAGCDETYTLDEVRDMIDQWQEIMPWLMAHPDRKQELASARPATNPTRT